MRQNSSFAPAYTGEKGGLGMTMREQTCCFTGHRDIPSTQRRVLVENLEETVRQLIGRGIRYFGAGGALGFDTLAAQTLLGLLGDKISVSVPA